MESSISTEDAQGHFELKSMIFSYITPLILKAVVLLDIPNMLAKSGPLSLDQIVSKLKNAKNPQKDVLQRILHFLVHKKVFNETTGESGEVCYSINSISKWLAEEYHFLLLLMHPYGLNGFQKIHEAILDGGYAYAIANKVHVWEHGKYDSEYNKLLNDGMIVWSGVTMSLILDNYDGFKNINTLVDVGGGLGMCIDKIVQKYPNIKGINFDLPHIVKTAPNYTGVHHVAGDMFEYVPSGDAMMIKTVFLNFNDEDCLKLLKNCYNALPNGGKVIVVEPIHTMDGPFEFDLDILMVGYTDGGKSRRFEEHKALLEKSGFSNITVKNVPSKEQVIEAYKMDKQSRLVAL